MKKFVAIIVASVIMGGAFHLDEMIKIPFLIRHYSEHKIQHPDDSVLAFLYKHYIFNQKAESEKDKKSDSQLPFKSTQSFHSHFVPFTFENKSMEIVCESGNINFIPYAVTNTLSRHFDIWQPPKI